jgi:predicted negative regulator of RcsB-dependent stress response
MEFKKLPVASIIIEVFSVILGVLVALAVNEWRTTVNNQDQGLAAYEKIVKEVERNKNKVDELLLNHMAILVEIDSVIAKLKREDEKLTFGQINFETPSSTAWEAAKLTAAVNYLEYDIVEKVTSVY